MSQIRCVSICDSEGNTHTTLSMPRDVLEKLNGRIDSIDEQAGTKIRDRLLEVLAAMVIQSLDEFRQSDMFKTLPRHMPLGTVAGTAIIREEPENDDKD